MAENIKDNNVLASGYMRAFSKTNTWRRLNVSKKVDMEEKDQICDKKCCSCKKRLSMEDDKEDASKPDG